MGYLHKPIWTTEHNDKYSSIREKVHTHHTASIISQKFILNQYCRESRGRISDIARRATRQSTSSDSTDKTSTHTIRTNWNTSTKHCLSPVRVSRTILCTVLGGRCIHGDVPSYKPPPPPARLQCNPSCCECSRPIDLRKPCILLPKS